MKLSAFEINQKIEELACVEVLDDGRYMTDSGNIFTEEEYEAEWAKMMLTKDQKVENICNLNNAIKDDIESLDKEIARLEAMKKRQKNTQDRLKNKILPLLLNGEKYRTDSKKYSIYYQTKPHTVLAGGEKKDDMSEEFALSLPKEFVKITYSLRGREVEKAFKDGVEIPFAHQEFNTSMVIRG